MNSDHKNAFLKAFAAKHNLDSKDCAVIRHRAADGTTVGYKIQFPDGAETLAFTPEEIHRYTDQWFAEKRAAELAEFDAKYRIATKEEFDAKYRIATKEEFDAAFAEANGFIHRDLVTQEFRRMFAYGYISAGVYGVLNYILAQKNLRLGSRELYYDKN